MARTFSLFFVFLIMLSALCPVFSSDGTPPDISARAYIVTQADSGEVLAEHNADEPMLIASITKIMTALLAIEGCDLNEKVTIRPEWTGIEGSTMFLSPGQKLTVLDLLYGLLLASGNDAASALACITAGSEEAFVRKMNERAAALGCTNTHFENPSGLDAEDHYGSARDLSRIMAEAVKNEMFLKICGCESHTVGENTFVNHNRLLTECEGVLAGKTGYTQAAGRTLVSCCQRKGITLICVTLNDPDDWSDHKALFDWAYGMYEETVLLTGAERWTVSVIGGMEDEVYAVPAEPLSVAVRDDQSVSMTVSLPVFAYAGIREGDTAGEAAVLLNGEKTAAVRLLYAQSVPAAEIEKPTLLERIRMIFGNGEREIYTLE